MSITINAAAYLLLGVLMLVFEHLGVERVAVVGQKTRRLAVVLAAAQGDLDVAKLRLHGVGVPPGGAFEFDGLARQQI